MFATIKDVPKWLDGVTMTDGIKVSGKGLIYLLFKANGDLSKMPTACYSDKYRNK